MLQVFNLEIISKDQSEIIVGIFATIVAFVVYIFELYISPKEDDEIFKKLNIKKINL